MKTHRGGSFLKAKNSRHGMLTSKVDFDKSSENLIKETNKVIVVPQIKTLYNFNPDNERAYDDIDDEHGEETITPHNLTPNSKLAEIYRSNKLSVIGPN